MQAGGEVGIGFEALLGFLLESIPTPSDASQEIDSALVVLIHARAGETEGCQCCLHAEARVGERRRRVVRPRRPSSSSRARLGSGTIAIVPFVVKLLMSQA